MQKCLIVAIAEDFAIGRAGGMPWHISGDLKYFKAVTMGCPVIMGRRTWESIGSRPLPGRQNIVITRSRDAVFQGAQAVSSLKEAFALCAEAPRAFVMGGARVYADAIDLVDRMYVTHVRTRVADADAYFPRFGEEQWERTSQGPWLTDERSGLEYSFVVYDRIGWNQKENHLAAGSP